MSWLPDWLNAFGFLGLWTMLVGAVGLLGAVALIAIAIGGAPALAAMLGQRIARLIGEFLATTIGLVLVVGACCWFASAFVTGHHAATECEARIEQLKHDATAAAAKRDAEIRVLIEGRYQPEIERLQQEAADHANEVAEYERQIAALNIAGCKLRPDALRLRKPAQRRPGS
ncbi:MAG: hypothetical protein AB7U62_17695 [Pseudolabrys sp.]